MNLHPILQKTFFDLGHTTSIDPEKARKLIRAAEKVNHSGFMRCAFPSHEGDKQLVELVDQWRDRFEPLSIAAINKWLASHKRSICDSSYRLQVPT